ncbi:4-hydroxybenzoyl-CoA reductase [Roseomonas nepalensis]|uniref:4-hydroxybenzoyl-CoA reductase n=1 Tax=Muricoccus nepalensis TaxID=1854500 RepID=A0A502GG47_9PROT|nr:SRPBCC family protein [Roseomonas nepalensis]TPG59693.1 4-hydroxybenzoyl-CoA reductase [Roseomonas nepalensis]
MELEKTLTVAAPIARVWDLLLDPRVMAGCVPGTGAVEVLSGTEYLAEITVKISFVAARFKVRTRILEARAPGYLRIEGTGEDASVASSMRQESELFLTDLGDGQTELRVRVKAEVLGRLGSFGLGMMATKADRMWDEFGANFAAAARHDAEAAGAPAPAAVKALPPADEAVPPPAPPPGPASPDPSHGPARARWWQRLVGAAAPAAPLGERRLPTDIYVELHRADGVVKVLWPASAAPEAVRWLRELR